MKKKFTLLFLTLFLALIPKTHLTSYYCGVGQKAHNIISLPDGNKVQKMSSEIEDDEFRPINISIETDLVEDGDKIKNMITSALNQCIETLKKLIKVKPLSYKISVNKEVAEGWGFSNINEDITDSSKGINTDLLVLVKSDSDHNFIYTGNSDIKYMDPITKRPIVRIIEIDTSFDFKYENGDQYMKTLILHKFTHILGFLYDYFDNYEKKLSNTVST